MRQPHAFCVCVGLLFMGSLMGRTVFAEDDQYGCKVLLCLSDKRGAETEVECRPPMARLRHDLKKGRGFPSCQMGEDTQTQQGFSYFDPCPKPLSPLPIRQYGTTREMAKAGRYVMGGGDTDGRHGHKKTCVGKALGHTIFYLGMDKRISATIYDVVQTMPIVTPPNYIDVMRGGELLQRIRWSL